MSLTPVKDSKNYRKDYYYIYQMVYKRGKGHLKYYYNYNNILEITFVNKYYSYFKLISI
jgi:hypothetical protein